MFINYWEFLMSIAIALHVLLVVVWVGGMIFAWSFLRPAAVEVLEPPLRLKLWLAVFNRFFPIVWGALLVILATGLWMMFGYYSGFSGVGMQVHIMLVLGLIMMVIFMHVYFGPYKKLQAAVAAEQWPVGGENLAKIRRLVGINSIIGGLTIVVATLGKYYV